MLLGQMKFTCNPAVSSERSWRQLLVIEGLCLCVSIDSVNIQSEFICKLPLWEINMYFQLLDMLQPFFSISNVQAFSATRLSRQLHLSCSIRSVLASTLVYI